MVARVSVLPDLRKDPSLRFTEVGALLRLLEVNAVSPDEWSRLIDSQPQHWGARQGGTRMRGQLAVRGATDRTTCGRFGIGYRSTTRRVTSTPVATSRSVTHLGPTVVARCCTTSDHSPWTACDPNLLSGRYGQPRNERIAAVNARASSIHGKWPASDCTTTLASGKTRAASRTMPGVTKLSRSPA